MTDMEKYTNLMDEKTYDEMDEAEKSFCRRYEADQYLPKIESLRRKGVPDYVISAYLQDLYNDYLVEDDTYIADEAGISDDDYDKGSDYYWNEMTGNNPLK